MMKQQYRVLISVLLILSMLFSMQVPVLAEGIETTLPSVYTGATVTVPATENGVIKLTTADQFVAWAKSVNTNNRYSDTKIELHTDVILNEGDAGKWKEEAPQYSWTAIDWFAGTFDGMGHTVSGVYINATPTWNQPQGLFCRLAGDVVIENLGVVNSYICTNKTYAGTIVGSDENATSAVIRNCYANAIVTASQYVGGIIGIVRATNAEIQSCVVAGTVSSTATGTPSAAGGIIGVTSRFTNDTAHPVITDCVSFANVSIGGTSSVDGGLLVGLAHNVTIERSLSYGSTTGTGLRQALIGNVAQRDGDSKQPTIAVKDCYVFADQYACGHKWGGVTTDYTQNANCGTVYTIADSTSTKGSGAADLLKTLNFHGNNSSDTEFATAPWVTREGDYPMPKAVYDNFFKIKMKYVQSNKTDEALGIRLIAEVSSLEYSKVGFEVKVTANNTEKTATLTTTTVYRSITDTTYGNVSAGDGRYFVALAITNLPVTGEVTVAVTPIGACGTDSERGAAYEIVYQDGAYSSSARVADDVAVYNALIGASASDALLAECDAFATAVLALTESEVTFGTDATADYDILIGDTGHALSTAAKETLSGNRYSITASDDKIVIVAGNDLLLVDALQYFANNMIVNGGFEVPAGGYVSGEYTALSITATQYSIVYATEDYEYVATEKDDDTSYTQSYHQTFAENFAAMLNTLTGEPFAVVAEGDTFTTANAIYLDNDNSKGSDLAYYQSGAYVENGNIYLCGWNFDALAEACEQFCNRLQDANDLIGSDGASFYASNQLVWSNAQMSYNVPLPEGINCVGANIAVNNGVVLSYKDTTADTYSSYVQLLKDNGYAGYYSREASENSFAGYRKGEEAVWVYYLGNTGELRVILEPYTALPTFTADGEKVTEAQLTQFGFPYEDYNSDTANGMSYIITLEDGRYIIVDGGCELIDTYGLSEKLYNYLKANNKRSDGKIVIAAWILTHSHVDHYQTFERFGQSYGSEVTLEYVLYNIPTDIAVADTTNKDTYLYRKMDTLISYYPGAKEYTLHTGFEFTVGGVSVEILSTYEDIYPNLLEEMNDTCTTFRVTFHKGDTADEASVIFLADIYRVHANRLVAMWGDYLKTDIVQVAHHGWDNGGSQALYEKIHADYALWSNSEKHLHATSGYGNYIREMLKGINASIQFYSNTDANGNAMNTTVTFEGGITCTKTAQSF